MIRSSPACSRKKLSKGRVHRFYFDTHLLVVEATQVLDVPDVWDAMTVGPLKAVGHWTDDLHHDEGTFPRGRELVHSLGVLDATQD
jgi:hypothetical protein